METEFGKAVKELAATLSLDEDVARRIVMKLVETKMDYLGPLVDQIRGALYPEIVKTAHSLKGVSLELRLHTLSGLAQDMESAARDNQAIDYFSILARMKECFDALESELSGNG
jgi:HPt (histidine-containing phosphotransfer) domain-containing protein